MRVGPRLPEPKDVLYRIKRGLAGYVSYLAACEMNVAFTEYVLYEPVLRILTARGYTARCEVICPGIPQPDRGDRKRIDFEAERENVHFALEVKWAKRRRIDVENDYIKLLGFCRTVSGGRSFLCVFGRESNIRNVDLVPNTFAEVGRPVFADFGITKYGCRIFEPLPSK
jgi:hypothetical protein